MANDACETAVFGCKRAGGARDVVDGEDGHVRLAGGYAGDACVDDGRYIGELWGGSGGDLGSGDGCDVLIVGQLAGDAGNDGVVGEVKTGTQLAFGKTG